MSLRIHTAIGWGIQADRLEKLAKIAPHSDGFGEAMDAAMGKIVTPLDVPRELAQKVRNERNGQPPFFCHHKIDENDHAGRRLLLADETGDALYVHASDSDMERVNHYIFFPSSHDRRKWYRWNDDIDYALLYRWRDGCNEQYDPIPEDRVRFVAYTPYPWSTYVMKQDGTPVRWSESMMLQRHPELVAAVPSEIRWYLTQFDILDDVGVNELRPIVAEWWS